MTADRSQRWPGLSRECQTFLLNGNSALTLQIAPFKIKKMNTARMSAQSLPGFGAIRFFFVVIRSYPLMQ